MSELAAFHVNVESSGSGVTLCISGEIDLEALPAMHAATEEAMALSPTWVGVDVAGVSFIDSSGLNALLALRKRCLDIGAGVAVLNAPRQVLALLDMTGLTEYFISANDHTDDTDAEG